MPALLGRHGPLHESDRDQHKRSGYRERLWDRVNPNLKNKVFPHYPGMLDSWCNVASSSRTCVPEAAHLFVSCGAEGAQNWGYAWNSWREWLVRSASILVRAWAGGHADAHVYADASRDGCAEARRAGTEQPRYRRSGLSRVSISDRYPGQHSARAQPLLPRRSRGRGRAHRAGVSLARSGICRGRVELAGTGEATTLPAVYHWSILLRGLDKAAPVGLPCRRRTWPQHWTPSGGWRTMPANESVLRRNEIETGSGRPRVLADISETPRPARRIRPGGCRCPWRLGDGAP